MQNDNKVYFKATKDNIIVMLDEDADFEELKNSLYTKALDARKFFGNTAALISFKGRPLNENEERTLTKIIEETTDLKIIVVEESKANTVFGAKPAIKEPVVEPVIEPAEPVLNNSPVKEPPQKSPPWGISLFTKSAKEKQSDSDTVVSKTPKKDITDTRISRGSQNRNAPKTVSSTPQPRQAPAERKAPSAHASANPTHIRPNLMEQAVQRPIMPFDTEDAVFHKGSLRSGMCIESEGSVVVLGDVNPGGEIIAGGNIVVLGVLKGLAHAGAYGNKSAFVAAISLQPVQLRIANIITSVAEELTKRRNQPPVPSYAYIHDEQIYIAPLI